MGRRGNPYDNAKAESFMNEDPQGKRMTQPRGLPSVIDGDARTSTSPK
jgi:transposase InsO family protein